MTVANRISLWHAYTLKNKLKTNNDNSEFGLRPMAGRSNRVCLGKCVVHLTNKSTKRHKPVIEVIYIVGLCIWLLNAVHTLILK